MFRLSRSKPPTQERDEEGQPSKRSRRKSGQLEPPQVVVRDVEQFAFMFFNGEKNFGENLTILRYRLSRGITFQHNLDKYKTFFQGEQEALVVGREINYPNYHGSPLAEPSYHDNPVAESKVFGRLPVFPLGAADFEKAFVYNTSGQGYVKILRAGVPRLVRAINSGNSSIGHPIQPGKRLLINRRMEEEHPDDWNVAHDEEPMEVAEAEMERGLDKMKNLSNKLEVHFTLSTVLSPDDLIISYSPEIVKMRPSSRLAPLPGRLALRILRTEAKAEAGEEMREAVYDIFIERALEDILTDWEVKIPREDLGLGPTGKYISLYGEISEATGE